MTSRTYGRLVAAAHHARGMRRPDLLLRFAVWRLKRIDPKNPVFM